MGSATSTEATVEEVKVVMRFSEDLKCQLKVERTRPTPEDMNADTKFSEDLRCQLKVERTRSMRGGEKMISSTTPSISLNKYAIVLTKNMIGEMHPERNQQKRQGPQSR